MRGFWALFPASPFSFPSTNSFTASASLRQHDTLNHVVSSQFSTSSDYFQPCGHSATRSLDTTWRLATDKLVTGVPSSDAR
jgi:hypothetical protein